MRIFTVTCDSRPAALVRASTPRDAITIALELAEERNILGVLAAPRRFETRMPTESEMAEWRRHQDTDRLILDRPFAA